MEKEIKPLSELSGMPKSITEIDERSEMIKRQEEIIEDLPNLVNNMDLSSKVKQDLLWADRYRLENNLPCWFMTIPEVLLIHDSNLLERIGDDELCTWRTDGALDTILDSNCRKINPARSWVHVFVQRVKYINHNDILEWLTESGGFLHEKCLATEIRHSRYNDITTLADAMHRSIMAYLCGVDEIASRTAKEHSIDSDDEQDQQVEFDFFEKLQNEGNPVSDDHLAEVRKKSNLLEKPQDKALDKMLNDMGVYMPGFGVSDKNDADIRFPDGETLLRDFVLTPKEKGKPNSAIHNNYLNYDDIEKHKDVIKEFIEYKRKDGTVMHRPKAFVCLTRLFNSLDSESQELLIQFMREKNINLSDDEWTKNCVNSKGEVTALIRLALQLNEWYRDENEETKDQGNLFTIKFFKKDLEYLDSTESTAKVKRCLQGKKFNEGIS